MTSTSGPEAGDLTHDAFLDGRLRISQPKRGYRAGIDAVLLAAAVPARAGETVLELGCGAGVASLCLGVRVPGLSLAGLEVQPDYADLARRNGADNGIALCVHTGDVAAMPAGLRQQTFHHVIANPPYYMTPSYTAARDPGRETAHGEVTPLADWIESATRRLRPKGLLTLIQRADRLRDVLSGCDDRLGSLTVLPIQARKDRSAQLIIVSARKSGRSALTLRNPLILHEGPHHRIDAESYTESVKGILRDGLPLFGSW